MCSWDHPLEFKKNAIFVQSSMRRDQIKKV
jgi:hypothetical protein